MVTIDKFSDIPYSQNNEAQDYVDAFNLQTGVIDFETLQEYITSPYSFNKNALENITSITDVMQNDFNTNINVVLGNKEELFQSWIDNIIKNVVNWNASGTYHKNDIVIYNSDTSTLYYCIKDCDGSIALNNTEYWLTIRTKGEKGQDVYDLNYRGEISYTNTTYGVNDIVYTNHKNASKDIIFYVCIQSIHYSSNEQVITDISVDDTHWVQLFIVPKDAFEIYWTMPNQTFFNNPNSPSVFGVVQNSILIDDYDNAIDLVEEIRTAPALNLADDYILSFNVYGQKNTGQYDDTPIQCLGKFTYANTFTLGDDEYVFYKMPIKNIFVEYFNIPTSPNMAIVGFVHKVYNVVEEEYFILSVLDEYGNLYVENGFVDEEHNAITTEYYQSILPHAPLIKIECNRYISETPIIKIVDRVHSESANNLQYLKLQSTALNIVDDNNNNLTTIIDNLESRNNL